MRAQHRHRLEVDVAHPCGELVGGGVVVHIRHGDDRRCGIASHIDGTRTAVDLVGGGRVEGAVGECGRQGDARKTPDYKLVVRGGIVVATDYHHIIAGVMDVVHIFLPRKFVAPHKREHTGKIRKHGDHIVVATSGVFAYARHDADRRGVVIRHQLFIASGRCQDFDIFYIHRAGREIVEVDLPHNGMGSFCPAKEGFVPQYPDVRHPHVGG